MPEPKFKVGDLVRLKPEPPPVGEIVRMWYGTTWPAGRYGLPRQAIYYQVEWPSGQQSTMLNQNDYEHIDQVPDWDSCECERWRDGRVWCSVHGTTKSD